jgi:hypothetical protein
MPWPFKRKAKESDATETPLGTAILTLHSSVERLLEEATGLNDPQRCVLLSAAAGAAVTVGAFGDDQIKRHRDSVEYLPTNTGELDPDRHVQFAKALDHGQAAAAERAYRVVTWALVADMAVHLWRPNYDLEIAECAQTFGLSNVYETTIVNLGRPGDDESEDAEADRRYDLVKGTLICMIAAALDEEIDPEDPLVLLGIDVWTPYFGAGLETAGQCLSQLAPDGLPIWKATDETDAP